MRHRARRMEHRIARAVSAGGISGGVAGAVAGSAVAGKRTERKNTASKENRGNTTSSMGQRAGSKVGAVLDTKNKVKDKANAVKENIKDMPTQTAYAVYSAKDHIPRPVHIGCRAKAGDVEHGREEDPRI